MGQFLPSRGLWQGDPLSPYLFLLCAEGLSALIQTTKREGRISGVPIAVEGTRLSHLFFTDDSLLFCRANSMEWSTILELLNLYERASGQQLNAAKTSVFFSRNTRNDFKEWVSSTAGLSAVQGFEKYLGLPTMVGRSKTRSFASLVSRVRKKLEGWKEKFLSQARKEVLLKAVVQAIPICAMSVFKLPKTLCKQLNYLMSNFWWNHNRESKGVRLINWKRLGVAKQQAGMDFRDIEAFNLALLARETLEGGLWWRVGNGESIKVWKDKWLPSSSTPQILSPVNGLDEEARVSSLIDPGSGGWNMPLLRSIFSPWEVELIGKVEMSCHSIWSCPSAVAVWQDANRKVQKLSTIANEGWELVEQLWGKLEEDEFVEAMTIARLLWMRRNKWVFYGQFSPPVQVLKQAREAMDSFAITHTPSTQAVQVPVRCMLKWIKPIQGEVKCNWDAAINSKNRCMGVGVVVRDDKGRDVAAKARFFPSIVNPTVAESMGAWQAVVMCCDMRFPQVVFEGDSWNVVSALNKEDPCWSSFGQIIEDIRAKLQDIPSVRVQHVPREANNVTHSLAKAVVSQMLDNS
ncbi:uncharacterized protein LOC133881223 [Alnus glutinosa]|uniref:uncharacterized protein LOC133881223 n=1 Tax=Alnus glutinosa TaxID=3517 RepID=UPI002D78ABA2|nr:uncharacterized protein LOC133881223 [Alnus glutinosa]